jgi:hypothetical protein
MTFVYHLTRPKPESPTSLVLDYVLSLIGSMLQVDLFRGKNVQSQYGKCMFIQVPIIICRVIEGGL